MKFFVKDPASTLDYNMDWTLWLDGDDITISTWVIDSPLVSMSESETTKITTIFVAGGVDGETYTLTNNINTISGRVDERSIILRVANR